MPEVLLNPREQDLAYERAKRMYAMAYPNRDLDPTEDVFQRKLKACLTDAFKKKQALVTATFAVYSNQDPNHDYSFITVGLSNELNPGEAWRRCKKFLKRPFNYFGSLASRMEFYREGGQYHPHLHIFVDCKVPKGKVIRDLARTFKIEPQFVDVKCRDRQQHWDYINGKKQESKQEDMAKDDEVRRSLGDCPSVIFSNASV